MKRDLTRRSFVKNAAVSAVMLTAANSLSAAGSDPASGEISSYKKRNRKRKPGFSDDGLCNPAITMRPCHLLSTVCILGGAKCPLIEEGKAKMITDRLKVDPTTAIRLSTDVDEIPRYTLLRIEDHASPDTTDIFNRKRDLDVLQRLGLAPGDTRRARYLYELLFSRINTTLNICSYNTPGWKGCELAHSGAYEKIHAKGWQAIVYQRSKAEMADFRQRNENDIKTADRLYVRPHHLMCFSCWYDGGKGQTPRSNDTLFEIWQRIKSNPEIPVTLVESTCMACDCCDGFHPQNGRCVHSCGLIRDYKKDLDVFQKMGLMPGSTMKAKEVFALLFEKVTSTREICGYGDGIVRSEEWRICSDPNGNPGYARTRITGVF
jgi:hypothetical protein